MGNVPTGHNQKNSGICFIELLLGGILECKVGGVNSLLILKWDLIEIVHSLTCLHCSKNALSAQFSDVPLPFWMTISYCS